MTSPTQAMAREAIDSLTLALSRITVLLMADDVALLSAAQEHVVQARKLLIAQYQPNSEEIGR